MSLVDSKQCTYDSEDVHKCKTKDTSSISRSQQVNKKHKIKRLAALL